MVDSIKLFVDDIKSGKIKALKMIDCVCPTKDNLTYKNRINVIQKIKEVSEDSILLEYVGNDKKEYKANKYFNTFLDYDGNVLTNHCATYKVMEVC